MRIAVVWPKPRRDRWERGRTDPEHSPDHSDGLLALREEGFDVAIEESLGVPWNPLARMHEFWSALDPLRALRLAWRARRYDAAVCIGDATAFVLMQLRRLFRFRLPVVLIDPALSTDYPRRKRLQDFVLPRAQKVIVYGRTQLDYLAEHYGGRVDATFLPHRADTEFYRPGDEGPPPAPYVLSIGNDYSRDFDTVVRAAEICAAKPGLAHRFRLHTTRAVPASPHVDVTRNMLSYVELRALFRQASVVIISLHDMIHAGGINSLLEAMACGRPVVVSGSRGILDYVQHDESALVVPPGDAQAMAAAVTRLLADPAEAARLGEGARRFVVESCALRGYARSVAAILRAAAGRPTRPADARQEVAVP